MQGIVELAISSASVIEPGAQDFPLFYDVNNENVLAGVAKIDTSPISELRQSAQMTKKPAPRENVQNKSSSSGF